MSQIIDLKSLQIQTIANASSLNYGRNLQSSAKSIQKINQGCGTIGGDGNIISASINTVVDDDLIDAYVPVAPKRQT